MFRLRGLGDAAHLRKAARLIPRTKSNYATGFVLRAAARFHARRNDPEACAVAARGAARAFDAATSHLWRPRRARPRALARVAQGRARAATLALLPGSGPPAPRADAARAAAVAAVAKLRGDEAIYEACARAAGDALPRAAAALAGAPSLDDGEVPEVVDDDVDPWLSLSVYLGNVAASLLAASAPFYNNQDTIHTALATATDSPRRSSSGTPCSSNESGSFK